MTKSQPPPRRCSHTGEQPVQVGAFTIHASGTDYLKDPALLAGYDLLMPLDAFRLPAYGFGQRYNVLAAPIPDFQPPPPAFRWLLEQEVIPALADGQKVLMFCIGSHGRTGTALASLIALLEPNAKDPIAITRSRHCHRAVETREQAEYVFGLLGKPLPKQWRRLRSHP